MQDNWQNGSGGPSAPHLFFWPDEAQIANEIANWLGAESAPYDAMALSAVLRGGKSAIVLWRGPENNLAACLARGHGVALALEDWKAAARGLLVLFRQNRRKTVLVNSSGLGKGGLDDLARHLGRPAPDLPLTEVATPALARVLAGLAQHQDADLQQLTLELRTASLPCSDLPLTDVMEIVAVETAEKAHAAVGFGQSIAAMEAEIAALRAALAAAETALQDAEASQFEAVARIDLMQSQIELVHDVMTRQQDTGFASLEATALLADTNKVLLATQTSANGILTARIEAQRQEVARLTAALEEERRDKADATARLAAQSADLDLLRTQIGMADGAVTHVDSQARTANELASLRVQALQAQLETQEQSAAEAERRLALQQQEAASLSADLAAQSQTIAELQDSLAKAATDPDPGADLLLIQLGLLQDLMAQGSFATAAALPADPTTDPAPRTEAWDKALAKALAAARTESEQRARLERDLNALRAEVQARGRREEDLTYNRKLFAMMTAEANVALDEIARLSQVNPDAGHMKEAAGH